MKISKMALAGAMLTVVTSMAQGEEARTGTVTVVDRIHGSITIRQPQGGTVGSGSGVPTEQFRIQAGMLEPVHAGDEVKFTVSEKDGVKTVTKIDVK